MNARGRFKRGTFAPSQRPNFFSQDEVARAYLTTVPRSENIWLFDQLQLQLQLDQLVGGSHLHVCGGTPGESIHITHDLAAVSPSEWVSFDKTGTTITFASKADGKTDIRIGAASSALALALLDARSARRSFVSRLDHDARYFHDQDDFSPHILQIARSETSQFIRNASLAILWSQHEPFVRLFASDPSSKGPGVGVAVLIGYGHVDKLLEVL